MEPELISTASDLVIGIVGLLLTWLGMTARKWINEKIESEALSAALLRLEGAVEVGVRDVAQTLVPEIRAAAEDGKITVVEANRLKRMAKDAALDQLTRADKRRIEEVFEMAQLDRILGRLTEAAVQKMKKEGVS